MFDSLKISNIPTFLFFFFFLTYLHKRGREIQSSDIRFIRPCVECKDILEKCSSPFSLVSAFIFIFYFLYVHIKGGERGFELVTSTS
jgi:hypothetical protein